MKKATLIVLAILAALALGWFVGSGGRPEVVAVPSARPLPKVKVLDPPPSLPAPGSPSSVGAPSSSAPKQTGFMEAFDATPNRKGYRLTDLDARVDEGGTLVTDAYEVEPGVFNFSTLTPRLAALQDGSPGVQMAVKRYQFNVSGGYFLDYEATVPVSPGARSGLNFDEGDQSFSSQLRVELVPDSTQIRVMARDYRTNNPPQVSTPPTADDLP